jgi:hypothetical protein
LTIVEDAQLEAVHSRDRSTREAVSRLETSRGQGRAKAGVADEAASTKGRKYSAGLNQLLFRVKVDPILYFIYSKTTYLAGKLAMVEGQGGP